MKTEEKILKRLNLYRYVPAIGRFVKVIKESFPIVKE